MNILVAVIFVPAAAAAGCLAFRRLAPWLALLVAAGIFIAALKIFLATQVLAPFLALRAYPFSAGIFVLVSLLTLLITLYSIKFMDGKGRQGEYYGYVLLTLGATAGALFASDFLTLLLFWGALGIPLYLLIGLGGPAAAGAAKRTLLTVGGADALMIIGIGLVWALTKNLQIGGWPLPLTSPLAVIAFLALATGAFAKAGVMPLHSWIPAAAEHAPAPVMALLPAALDKLLGIYLLARICYDVFAVVPNSPLSLCLLALGSLTIVAAVLGALVQHDFKKLLAFHAVSQVGYMVLGVGTGLPVGVAGGLFHMINNAIYKPALFLCGGAVEQKTGTAELDKLGGLARSMPLTFTAFLVAAVSISGLPPFNGFVSKWLIYQSLVDLGRISPYWIIWLTAAMFGSAFTLASFVKLVHAIFLGQWSETTAKAGEVAWPMWLPMLILAGICAAFGLFAFELPLRYFIAPTVGRLTFSGIWQPGAATLLLLLGLLVGLLIYWLGRAGKVAVRPAFTGGEKLPEGAVKVTGLDFYDTVRRIKPLALAYAAGEKHYFDIYQWAVALVGWLSARLLWLDLKQPLGLIGWFRRDRRLTLHLLAALAAAELLAELLLFKLGVRELWTSLAALAALAAAFYLTGRLARIYGNE